MTLLETLEHLRAHAEYRRLDGIPGVAVALKYASVDNFMGKNVYGVFNEAYLHTLAARMLEEAAARLASARPGWTLLVYDALRPRSIQRVLWAHVIGTVEQAYVADPDRGSVHNYGLAVDLTCVDEGGAVADMGTGLDAFVPLSEPRYEDLYLASGELTPAQVASRRALRDAMSGAGFRPISNEWWHFDALPRAEIRERFRIIE